MVELPGCKGGAWVPPGLTLHHDSRGITRAFVSIAPATPLVLDVSSVVCSVRKALVSAFTGSIGQVLSSRGWKIVQGTASAFLWVVWRQATGQQPPLQLEILQKSIMYLRNSDKSWYLCTDWRWILKVCDQRQYHIPPIKEDQRGDVIQHTSPLAHPSRVCPETRNHICGSSVPRFPLVSGDIRATCLHSA